MNPQLTNIQYCVWNIYDIAGQNPDVAIHIDHIRVNAQYLAGEVATLNREQAALIEAMGNKDIEILDKDALIAELQEKVETKDIATQTEGDASQLSIATQTEGDASQLSKKEKACMQSGFDKKVDALSKNLKSVTDDNAAMADEVKKLKGALKSATDKLAAERRENAELKAREQLFARVARTLESAGFQ
jgi:regulator of replication initiation timing